MLKKYKKKRAVEEEDMRKQNKVESEVAEVEK